MVGDTGLPLLKMGVGIIYFDFEIKFYFYNLNYGIIKKHIHLAFIWYVYCGDQCILSGAMMLLLLLCPPDDSEMTLKVGKQ